MELFGHQSSIFPISYAEILQRVRHIDPIKHRSICNYINGTVTYLSPYISRGIISTKFFLSEILNRGHEPAKIEKFIQELAWRDYPIKESASMARAKIWRHKMHPAVQKEKKRLLNKHVNRTHNDLH